MPHVKPNMNSCTQITRAFAYQLSHRPRFFLPSTFHPICVSDCFPFRPKSAPAIRLPRCWQMASLFLSALTSLQIFAVAGRTFNVLNLCPQSISVYINGEKNASLSSSQAINLTLEDTWSGLIYTTANGGSGSGKGSVKAGFIGAVCVQNSYSKTGHR